MNNLTSRNHEGPFNQLATLVETDDFITSDKYLGIPQYSAGIIYFKRDFLFKSGDFRGEKCKSYVSNFQEFKGMKLLVGHSDIPTLKRHLHILRALGVTKVLGTNTLSTTDFSISLPLGLTNFTRESSLHQVFGDTSHFSRANSSIFCAEFSPEFLANFSSENNFQERGMLLGILRRLGKPYKVSIETPDMTPSGRISYLRKLRETPMVVCPEGNGVDTHRLWETLYMGGMPVVKNNKLLNPLFDVLPVLRVNDWNQLGDLEYMHSSWDKVHKMSWNPEVLGASYWKELITQSHS